MKNDLTKELGSNFIEKDLFNSIFKKQYIATEVNNEPDKYIIIGE